MSKVQMFVAFWRVLLVVGVTGELIAVFNASPNDTLSERVIRLQSAFPLFKWLMCWFLMWLTVHFLTGRLTGPSVTFMWNGRQLLLGWAAVTLMWACGRFIGARY